MIHVLNRSHTIPDAYWLKEELLIHVNRKHIDTVIAMPEVFGLTKDYIESIYRKHHEPLHHEGDARREIMMDLIKDGWIRIRDRTKIKSHQAWIVEAYTTDQDKWIAGFIEYAIRNNSMRISDTIRIQYTGGKHSFNDTSELFLQIIRGER